MGLRKLTKAQGDPQGLNGSHGSSEALTTTPMSSRGLKWTHEDLEGLTGRQWDTENSQGLTGIQKDSESRNGTQKTHKDSEGLAKAQSNLGRLHGSQDSSERHTRTQKESHETSATSGNTIYMH